MEYYLNCDVHCVVAACHQVKFGVQAVFGPSDPILGQHIHSICDALDIPHLEARLDLDSEAKEFSINLYPTQSLLNAAYQDVMTFLNWTKVAIIYEDDYGMNRWIITLLAYSLMRHVITFNFLTFNIHKIKQVDALM
jgi:hypothetical protein